MYIGRSKRKRNFSLLRLLIHRQFGFFCTQNAWKRKTGSRICNGLLLCFFLSLLYGTHTHLERKKTAVLACHSSLLSRESVSGRSFPSSSCPTRPPPPSSFLHSGGAFVPMGQWQQQRKKERKKPQRQKQHFPSSHIFLLLTAFSSFGPGRGREGGGGGGGRKKEGKGRFRPPWKEEEEKSANVFFGECLGKKNIAAINTSPKNAAEPA